MVFKDITATRARDIAEKKAQQEAMLAKAMSESMVTLTHELRTPLQGIMGVTSLLLQQANGLTNDVVDSLKLIMASSTLLLNLINNLLKVLLILPNILLRQRLCGGRSHQLLLLSVKPLELVLERGQRHLVLDPELLVGAHAVAELLQPGLQVHHALLLRAP